MRDPLALTCPGYPPAPEQLVSARRNPAIRALRISHGFENVASHYDDRRFAPVCGTAAETFYALSPQAESCTRGGSCDETMWKGSPMARKRRTYKFTWRSKKANHGRKGARGKDKSWGKKH